MRYQLLAAERIRALLESDQQCSHLRATLPIIEHNAQSAAILGDLAEVLPPPKALGSALSLACQQLRAYGYGEQAETLECLRQFVWLLDMARKHLDSDHAADVRQISEVIVEALDRTGVDASIELTPGVQCPVQFIGMRVVARYLHGCEWSLEIRRASPDQGDEVEPGIWIIDGGGLLPQGIILVEESFGHRLPETLLERLIDHMQRLHAAAAANVIRLCPPQAQDDDEEDAASAM